MSIFKIKPVDQKDLVSIDLSEWCDGEKAYVKRLSGMERLVFIDLFQKYSDSSLESRDRAVAAARIAIMALVTYDNKPVLSDSDIEDILAASFNPITAIIEALVMPFAKQDDKNGGLTKN